MIIQGIAAENFLKYRRLELEGLPERGLITISGKNESGKSSIGETVCFALFGRTFSVGANELDKLIRWGESRCSVTLDFSVEGRDHRIERFLDRDGNHSARLSTLDDPDHPLARGAEAVSRALVAMLGYDFDEFIESFYLAQREITTPHPHSHAIKLMAGVAPMETCQRELRDEMNAERSSMEETEGKVRDVESQLDGLAYDAQRIPALESELSSMQILEKDIAGKRDALDSSARDFQIKEPMLRQARRSRGRVSGWRFLFFLLTAGAFALWITLDQAVDTGISQAVLGLLPSGMGGASLVLYAAVFFALVFAWLWNRSSSLARRCNELEEAGANLGKALDDLGGLDAGLGQAGMTASDSGDNDDGSEETLTEPPDRERLSRGITDGSIRAAEADGPVAAEIERLDRISEEIKEKASGLEKTLAHERQRKQTHDKLSGMRDGFLQQISEKALRIKVREVADGLMLGVSRQLSHRFNHNLRGLAGKTLPLFTEGRYEHLQIADDLSVRAFSAEKRDFMMLDEISSGTQRQIMLALRLALSQELISRVVGSGQFLFLDEPFAFFDDTRTQNALKALPEFSGDITQFWICAQQFPEDCESDYRIGCDRETDTWVSS